MITSLSDLHVGLQAIFSEVTGIPLERVILASQGRPQPGGRDLYMTYKPYVVRTVGHPRKERSLVAATEDFNEDLLGSDWEDFEEVQITQAEVMVSVNILNTEASDTIWKLMNANFRQPVLEQLHSLGIAWRNTSEARRLSDIEQAGIQSRHQIDVNLYVGLAVTDSILRAAGFSYTIEDESGNIIADRSA